MPRSARFGAWYLPVRDWRVRDDSTSTWERAPSHLEQVAAVHSAAAAAAAMAGGTGPAPGAESQQRALLALPSPTDAWTGRRQRIPPPLPYHTASGAPVAPASPAAFFAPAGGGAAPAGAGAALPAHSRWLSGGGASSSGAASAGAGAGACGSSASPPSRADSVVMSNHVLEQEREARRLERARARLAKRLAASYRLMAYKGEACRVS